MYDCLEWWVGLDGVGESIGLGDVGDDYEGQLGGCSVRMSRFDLVGLLLAANSCDDRVTGIQERLANERSGDG